MFFREFSFLGLGAKGLFVGLWVCCLGPPGLDFKVNVTGFLVADGGAELGKPRS